MEDASDTELLKRYHELGSEEAFAELVRRHIDLVYSVAFRHTRIAAQAEEIVQAVFVILARKAAHLSSATALQSWLCETSRLTSLTFLRGERRRQMREQEVYMQSSLPDSPDDSAWNQLEPWLDEGLAQLNQQEREAVILRFFKESKMSEVALALQLSESAAQSRVHRAVEKLRKYFIKRGVITSTASLTTAISSNSMLTAPSGLAKAVAAMAIAKGAASGGSTLTLIKGALKLMVWTKAKTAIVTGIAIMVATGTVTLGVKKAIVHHENLVYEAIFRQPDADSMMTLEAAPSALILRPTHYPEASSRGIWTTSGKTVYVNASLKALFSWAYSVDQARVILPEGVSTDRFDYLNTLPNTKEALRAELEHRFGLVAQPEALPTDVLLLKEKNPERLDSHLTQGGNFACYGTGIGNTQYRYFTNAPLSLLADQIVEGFFSKVCLDKTDARNKYDFELQWEEPAGLTGDARLAALRPVMENQLNAMGLELAPARESVEMLVVTKRTSI